MAGDSLPVDLRSDTVTRPSPAMRKAISQAEVGDAVIDIDPTVERLEKLTAELLGKEAAIYMPSGSMTNQIAIRAHCIPGDEFLCEEHCHIFNYEQGAFAQLSGISARTVLGEHGVMRLEQLTDLVCPGNDHQLRTRLICLENTHNRGAGTIQPFDEVRDINQWAHGQGLATHLDGARLFNAVVASGISSAEWCEPFDSVSICFSKGLGAPVGSALAGPAEFIQRAHRHRKLFGGAMRQAGIIAAGALYALENNIDRLAEDHARAQRLAEGIRDCPLFDLRPPRIDTNMVIFHVDPQLGTAAQVVEQLEEAGVRMLTVGRQLIRAVTHLDIDDAGLDRAIEVLHELGGANAPRPISSAK